jgi:hypothetical protein
MLVAESGDRIVGLRAFMRWRFRVRSTVLRAVRAVDTATHPEHQGRGIFSRLTTQALDELAGEVDMVYNTPNEKSLPGYLKMGWQRVGELPIALRLRKPLRVARGFRWRDTEAVSGRAPEVRAPLAADVLADEALSGFVLGCETSEERIHTTRDLEYLRWRYGAAPLLDYRAVRVGSPPDTGLAIFRVRPRGTLWESTISELLVRPGDVSAAKELLGAVVSSADVDHLTGHFPRGFTAARAARRAGFVRSPGGLTVVVNQLRDGIVPSPFDLRSWAFSLGDLEVF